MVYFPVKHAASPRGAALRMSTRSVPIPARLFEEERHARDGALVTDGTEPRWVGRARMRVGFAARDDPLDVAEKTA